MKKYFIKTFGCASNVSDSERIASYLEEQGMEKAASLEKADWVVINTCMVRQMAEDRVYGLVRNLNKLSSKPRIIVTGCMVGMALSDKSGKWLGYLKKRMPEVSQFLPISEVGFDYLPLRVDRKKALVPISNGCNNFCSYCVVPFTRGREVSRPFEEVVKECQRLKKEGYSEVMLLGQNVNSYGADLVNKQKVEFSLPDGRSVKPVLVKHLGRVRIPTLFPYLLEEVAKLGFEKVDFLSSNPWDFSDELIDVIAKYENITRQIHLPVQSGDDRILKKMNRWYSRDEYLHLVGKLKSKIENLRLSTDIIVGFCGETEKEFENTFDLCCKVGFVKAYISLYSDRPQTAAYKSFSDDVSYATKKQRWQILEDLINKPNLDKKKTKRLKKRGL